MTQAIPSERLILIPVSKINATQLRAGQFDSICADLKLSGACNIDYLKSIAEIATYFWALADVVPWCAYFFIDKNKSTIVGNGGFKGKPTKKKPLELGYEIAPAFRRLGYATEAVACLLNIAKSKKMEVVTAEVALANEASIKVLQKNDFEVTKDFLDTDYEPMRCFERHFIYDAVVNV